MHTYDDHFRDCHVMLVDDTISYFYDNLQLSKVNSTDLCSQCWSRIAMEGEEPPSYLPLPFSATPQDAGHLPTQTLMTNIRAILKPHNAKKEQT